VSTHLEPDVPVSGTPSGLDGIEFIEYATAQPLALGHVLERMGFQPVARHRSREVLLYRQGGYRGDVSFEVFNADHVQLRPSFVAARARRAAEWLGEEVLQRPVPLPADLPRRPVPASRERIP
jgi:4-hydroxyphenylpyruvate dioxygenase